MVSEAAVSAAGSAGGQQDKDAAPAAGGGGGGAPGGGGEDGELTDFKFTSSLMHDADNVASVKVSVESRLRRRGSFREVFKVYDETRCSVPL